MRDGVHRLRVRYSTSILDVHRFEKGDDNIKISKLFQPRMTKDDDSLPKAVQYLIKNMTFSVKLRAPFCQQFHGLSDDVVLAIVFLKI